jgi:hypothetical protein
LKKNRGAKAREKAQAGKALAAFLASLWGEEGIPQ